MIREGIKIFADGADIRAIKASINLDYIKGFTTNPTLMRKAGVQDYESFAREVLSFVTDKPISLEVFADHVDSIIAQARVIASWGKNVYVKVPVCTTDGKSLNAALKTLSDEGISLNITALMTIDQVADVLAHLNSETPSIISVFAGRIADTGVDPLPVMKKSLELIQQSGKNVELLWASPRELFNIVQAKQMGCHIITIDQRLLSKLGLLGKDLMEFSKETVQMFFNDAQASGFTIEVPEKFEVKTTVKIQ